MTDIQPRCGYAIADEDGIEQPCDRPATGWRWYQDCGHEDALDEACDWHANEGGRRIAEYELLRRQVEALRDEYAAIARAYHDGNRPTNAIVADAASHRLTRILPTEDR